MTVGAASFGRMFDRFADYLGAHRAHERAKQERDRALQRAIVGIAVTSFWLWQFVTGREVHASLWFAIFLGLVMPVLAVAYRRFLVTNPDGGVAAQYVFLVLDPVVN